jgi:hypothetical protein
MARSRPSCRSRWEQPSKPDTKGEQLRQLQAHLRAHRDIQYVWYDYTCMPQRSTTDVEDRTQADLKEFSLMLSSIADLYLTAKVLILLDTMYRTRFWCTMEGWCSMQTVTSSGVRPAREGEWRHTVSCIHNADENDKRALLTMSSKTPDEITAFLASPDVAVTNLKDKETMLPIVGKTDEHVREMMSGMHKTAGGKQTGDKDDTDKQRRLEELLGVTVPVHLISTPYSVPAGYAKAAEIKEDNHNPPHTYCYNPNADAPQDAGGGWMASWFRVCDRTKATNGTVFVVYNRKKDGKFGDGKYKGWFDGQAQQGELEQATRLGCTISWVGYSR